MIAELMHIMDDTAGIECTSKKTYEAGLAQWNANWELLMKDAKEKMQLTANYDKLNVSNIIYR